MKYSSVACHYLQIVFALSQHPKWFIYDGKAMLSYPGATHTRFALVIVGGRVLGVKIISLCYIISPFSYILRVRFGSGVSLEPKKKLNMF